MDINIGDTYLYVPGGIVVEVYDILRGGAFIELEDDNGMGITVTPAELANTDDYKRLG